MFIVDLFKKVFSVIVIILLVLCVLFGVVGLVTGQGLLSIVIAAGGILLVVLTFGLCGVILDMHTQLVDLNKNLKFQTYKMTKQ